MRILSLVLLLLTNTALNAQLSLGFQLESPEQEECLSAEQTNRIIQELEINKRKLEAKGIIPKAFEGRMPVLFDLPLEKSLGYEEYYSFYSVSNYVDHDPVEGGIEDWNCGNRSYDGPGFKHNGTDYFLFPFQFNMMVAEIVKVIAAADGVIIGKDTLNYDRQCGFTTDNWNALYVQHSDGTVAWYGHMKSGSVTSKYIGQSVSRGEQIGLVGSSGISTGPHLHFELRDASNAVLDPFFGPCNPTTASSLWTTQAPYYNSYINRIVTHDDLPVFMSCPDQDTINEQNLFLENELVYVGTYYRDIQTGQTTNWRVYRPDSTIFSTPSYTHTAAYAEGYVYIFGIFVPANPMSGTWWIEADYEGTTFVRTFDVCGPDDFEPNNSFAAAVALPLEGINKGVNLCESVDEDWYFFNTGVNTSAKARLLCLAADYNLEFYDGSQNLLANSLNFGKAEEQIILNSLSPSTNYYLRVTAASEEVTSISYCLKVTTSELDVWGDEEGNSLAATPLNYYPNPVSNVLTVEYDCPEQTIFKLYDLLGKEVFTQKATGSKHQLNLSELNDGVYFLRLGSEKTIRVHLVK